jgi:hypothetical protein
MMHPSHRPAGRRHPSRRPSFWLVLAAVLLTGAGGCSADGGNAEAGSPAASQPPTSLAAPSPSADVSPSSGPTSAPAKRGGPLKVGQKHRLDTGDAVIELVVLDHRSGDDYEGILVRSCNRGSTEVGVSRGPWTLGFDGFDSLHDGDVIGGGLPAPIYPYLEDRWLKKDECAKGWINYSSIAGQHPDGAQYAPQGVEPVRWVF